MRIAVCALATLYAGCAEPADDYPYDFCADPHTADARYCDPGMMDLTTHWSFETLNGDQRSLCLPGNPDVTVLVQTALGGGQVIAPCSSGQASASMKAFAALWVDVTSVTDHAYTSRKEVIGTGHNGHDLGTVIIYTDAGYLKVHWSILSGGGLGQHVRDEGVEKVRVILDGAVAEETDCYVHGYTEVTLGPFPVGGKTVRVEGLDSALNVVRTSNTIDATVVAGSTVDAIVKLPP